MQVLDPREVLVDQAMRTHGDFGVYGDLRAGLVAVSTDCTVELTDVENGIYVSVVPRDGHGHEYQFLVTPNGSIKDPVFGAGREEPMLEPNALIFEFGSVRLVKRGADNTLTHQPVWSDTQRAPPLDFDFGIRTQGLVAEEFTGVWQKLQQIDFARYARAIDNFFAVTPAAMQHNEHLHYVVDGREIVQWSRDSRLLRAPLRKPLMAIEQYLLQLFSTYRTEDMVASIGRRVEFTHLTLRNVQGLIGGQNVYIRGQQRIVTVQVVTPTESGFHEQRFQWRLTDTQRYDLLDILAKHPPWEIHIPPRPGIPDEPHQEITFDGMMDKSVTVAKWAGDRHPDFDALYNYLQRYVRQTEKMKPVWAGRYVHLESSN